MPTFLLIRHGDHGLLAKKLVGRTPGVHLSEGGLEQSRALAGLLAEAPIKAIYSSPVDRAMESAAPLAERLGLTVQVCPGVMEVDYGRFLGKTFKQLERINLWKQLKKDPASVRFPEGETLLEAQARAVSTLEELFAVRAEEDLAVLFSHGDIIRLLVAHYLQIPMDLYNRLGVNTTSITVLHRDKEGRTFLPHINQVVNFGFKKK